MDDKIKDFKCEKLRREIKEDKLHAVYCPWCEKSGHFMPIIKRDEHGGALVVGLICYSPKCKGDYQFVIDNGYLGQSFQT